LLARLDAPEIQIGEDIERQHPSERTRLWTSSQHQYIILGQETWRTGDITFVNVRLAASSELSMTERGNRFFRSLRKQQAQAECHIAGGND
jgi:hypothetical protein